MCDSASDSEPRVSVSFAEGVENGSKTSDASILNMVALLK